MKFPILLLQTALLPVAAALIATGCGGSGGGGSLPDPSLRVVNLSPDSTVDVLLNGEVFESNVAYTATETQSKTISEESYDVNTRATGTEAALASEAYDLGNGTDYLYTITGLQNPGDEVMKRLRGTMIAVNRTIPNGTRARVYAIHGYVAAPGSQTPNLVFRAPGNSPAFVFDTIALGGVSVRELDAGPQTFEIRAEGTESALASTTVTLNPGTIYIAAYSGVEGGVGDQAPAVRFLTLAPR